MTQKNEILAANDGHDGPAAHGTEESQVSGSETLSGSSEHDTNTCIDLLIRALELAKEQIHELDDEVATLKDQLTDIAQRNPSPAIVSAAGLKKPRRHEKAGLAEEKDLISLYGDEARLRPAKAEKVEPLSQPSHSSFDEIVFGISPGPSSIQTQTDAETASTGQHDGVRTHRGPEPLVDGGGGVCSDNMKPSEQRDGILITLDDLETDLSGTMLLVQHWWLMGDTDFFCVTTSQRVACPSK
ncbi:hypothetical protein SODALDRAFT_360865 [Sodiomyces alkalinus F11]|uniref:Uncharacterized protein n=1 Tax=Sodiomyces alkalinus (strain CBS 110278 / VKM F-3762 / F11) TaxID=1314773 RepID=A0A3N2PRN8_SODAK|nr:hypothetical protein SODALDRAFT_360865 [Sodiomyces alkalinus F11]ROT37179.1 hypothetical protein SODALDRAFT_360865 [Sodiomyces alkalinus F11]